MTMRLFVTGYGEQELDRYGRSQLSVHGLSEAGRLAVVASDVLVKQGLIEVVSSHFEPAAQTARIVAALPVAKLAIVGLSEFTGSAEGGFVPGDNDVEDQKAFVKRVGAGLYYISSKQQRRDAATLLIASADVQAAVRSILPEQPTTPDIANANIIEYEL